MQESAGSSGGNRLSHPLMEVGVRVVIFYDEAIGVFELRLVPEERLETDGPFKSTGNDAICICGVDLRRSVR